MYCIKICAGAGCLDAHDSGRLNDIWKCASPSDGLIDVCWSGMAHTRPSPRQSVGPTDYGVRVLLGGPCHALGGYFSFNYPPPVASRSCHGLRSSHPMPATLPPIAPLVPLRFQGRGILTADWPSLALPGSPACRLGATTSETWGREIVAEAARPTTAPPPTFTNFSRLFHPPRPRSRYLSSESSHTSLLLQL